MECLKKWSAHVLFHFVTLTVNTRLLYLSKLTFVLIIIKVKLQ